MWTAPRMIALLLASVAVAACYQMRSSSGGGQTDVVSRTLNPADIALPAGFRIKAVASKLTFPTGVAVDDKGVPYVIEAGYSYGEAFTTPRLLKVNPDGSLSEVARGGKNGPWTGIAYADGAFYVAEGGQLEGGRILRITPDGGITALVEKLPSFGDHHTNGPAIGRDGKIYFGPLVGVEYQKEDGELNSALRFGPLSIPANFSLERRTRSAFTEGRFKVSDRLTARAGLRADDIQAHGTQVNVQAGLRYNLMTDGPSLAVNYGTGFKPPSFFALGHPIVGNPGLRPEESRTIEASMASGEAAQSLMYRAAVFRARYIDLVDFDAGPPPRLVNRNDVEITGIDLSAAGRLNSDLGIQGTLTALSFDLPEGTPPLRSRPRLRATLQGVYDIRPDWTARLSGAWTSRVFDSSIPTGGRYLSPYLVIDGALTYTWRALHLTVALDNVFDRDYQQFIGFPGRGRRARLEMAFDI